MLVDIFAHPDRSFALLSVFYSQGRTGFTCSINVLIIDGNVEAFSLRFRFAANVTIKAVAQKRRQKEKTSVTPWSALVRDPTRMGRRRMDDRLFSAARSGTRLPKRLTIEHSRFSKARKHLSKEHGEL